MFRLLWGLTIIKCIFSVSAFLGNIMLGPTDLIFMSMETCDDQNQLDFLIKQKKYNRTTYVLDVTISSPFDIGNDMILEMKGSLKKQGGYKPGSFYMKDKTCDMLKLLLGDLFKDIMKAAGAEDCPIPAGDHAAVDYYFNNDKFIVPQLYGDFKMEVFLYRKNVRCGCFVMYYKLEPKEY